MAAGTEVSDGTNFVADLAVQSAIRHASLGSALP